MESKSFSSWCINVHEPYILKIGKLIQYSHISFLIRKVILPTQCIVYNREGRLLVTAYGTHVWKVCLILRTILYFILIFSLAPGLVTKEHRVYKWGKNRAKMHERFWSQETDGEDNPLWVGHQWWRGQCNANKNHVHCLHRGRHTGGHRNIGNQPEQQHDSEPLHTAD